MGLSQYRKYGSAAPGLIDSIKSGMVPHAFIIEADSIIDKEGFAAAFAQALICRQAPGEGCGRCVECRKIADGNYEDMYVVSPEESSSAKTRVASIKDSQIEELQADLKTKPTAGDRNIAVISGGDSMTKRAQTRFLKTLEEPPEGTVIMILSENSEELIPTIRSRCVAVRLYDVEDKSEGEHLDIASDLIKKVKKKSPFFEIKSVLDKEIKSRQDAFKLLDALETLMGREARAEAARPGTSMELDAISLIEETRRDIKLNASYNYMLRKLMLELEDLK